MIKKPLLRKFDNIADEISGGISQFFKKNVWALSLALLAGIYVNGFDITNVTFSMDDQFFWTTSHGTGWLVFDRWGLYLISKIIPLTSYYFISQIMGLIFLTLAAALAVSKYDNISKNAKIIFCVLAVSCPIFSYMGYFSMQTAYFYVGCFLSIASYRLYAKVISGGGSKLYFIPALVCMIWAVGIYQSYALLFLMPLAIDNFLKFIENKITIKQIIIITAYACLFIIIAVMFNYLIVEMLALQSNGYTSNFLYWLNRSLIKNVGEVFVQMYRMMVGAGIYPALTLFATISLFLSIPHIMNIQGDKSFKNFLRTFFVVFLFIFSGSALSTAVGGELPTRVQTSVTFFFAGSIFIYYIVSSKIEKLIITIFVVFTVFFHGGQVTKLFTSSYFALEADKAVATRVLENIYDVAPEFYYGEYPVAFIGNHDYKTRNMLITHKSSFDSTFMNEGKKNEESTLRYLKIMHGLPMEARSANEEEYAKARKYSETMPAWPAKDSVQLHDGVVVVKFAKQK